MAEERQDPTPEELFKQQRAGEARRQWPNGRLNALDEGAVAMRIQGSLKLGLVRVQFPYAIEHFSMPPQQAVDFALTLIQTARESTTEPLRVEL